MPWKLAGRWEAQLLPPYKLSAVTATTRGGTNLLMRHMFNLEWTRFGQVTASLIVRP
jgi:hypothetical protein